MRGQLKPSCLNTLFGTYEQPERSTSSAAGLKKPVVGVHVRVGVSVRLSASVGVGDTGGTVVRVSANGSGS